LRQPFRRRSLGHRDAGLNPRRRAARQRAIKPFSGLSRDCPAGAGADREGGVQQVPARDTAGSVQRGHVQPARRDGAGKSCLQASHLARIVQHGQPIAVFNGDAQLPNRALVRRRVTPRGAVLHRSRPAPRAARTERCRRGPSPRSFVPVPGRNRNIARRAGWPFRRACATARSRGRYP